MRRAPPSNCWSLLLLSNPRLSPRPHHIAHTIAPPQLAAQPSLQKKRKSYNLKEPVGHTSTHRTTDASIPPQTTPPFSPHQSLYHLFPNTPRRQHTPSLCYLRCCPATIVSAYFSFASRSSSGFTFVGCFLVCVCERHRGRGLLRTIFIYYPIHSCAHPSPHPPHHPSVHPYLARDGVRAEGPPEEEDVRLRPVFRGGGGGGGVVLIAWLDNVR